MRVLVTAGGTEEPLDGVRCLTNRSTGTTGGVLARFFAERGADVLLLHAARAPLVGTAVERETFVTFADLERALENHLSGCDWDVVVHLAAVGDYSVASIEVDGQRIPTGGGGKIGSDREVVIRLTPNPKLIDSLKIWSRNRAIRVVGFKFTNEPDPSKRRAQVQALLEREVADFVVHNDAREIDDERHRATIHDRRGPVVQSETKEQLAENLWQVLIAGDTAHLGRERDQ
jgi:phosphopantothenoylcysteine synthetase/decarboxylase